MVATRSILNGLEPVKNCPFCLKNGMIPEGKILGEAEWGYLVLEYDQAVPETLQLVPYRHKLSRSEWRLFLDSVFELLWQNRPDCSFNININFGEDAGQRQPHPHIWIIPRTGEFIGKGLAHFVSLEATARREFGLTLAQLVEDRLSSKD